MTWADINRRAAAVPGLRRKPGVLQADGRLVCETEADGFVTAYYGHKQRRASDGPDLSHAGTRGILRAALGSPDVVIRGASDGRYRCWVETDENLGRAFAWGDTREQAEAAALVALAEARGEWGPGRREQS